MENKPKQTNMGKGGQKLGNLDQGQQRNQAGPRNEQAGFQHEPKPGSNQQNKNPADQQGGQIGNQGRQAAQPRQGSRDENR